MRSSVGNAAQIVTRAKDQIETLRLDLTERYTDRR